MGVSYKGSVDLSTLSENLLKSVQSNFSEEILLGLSAGENKRISTDSVIYELQYENSEQKFSIAESQLNDEKLDLIDNLRPYLKLLSKDNNLK